MSDNNNNNDEPFGITAIPTTTDGTPVSIKFNEEILENTIFNTGIAQQPQTEAFAVYEGIKNSCDEYLIRLNSQQIDLNSQFLIYTVKNGLIRVFHRHSAMRALLRGHSGQIVSDIKFFHDGDVVGTIGNSSSSSSSSSSNSSGGGGNTKSTLIVWRVYEKAPEIGSERLLEISSLEEYGSTPDLTMSSLFWHPFNPNQFFFTHTTQSNNKQVATLVETTRIQTRLVDNTDPKDPSTAQHAVCVWNTPYCVMDGAIQLKVDNANDETTESGELVDMCWSGRDARHVLSVHKNGTIVLWDLKCKEKRSGPGSGLGLDSSDDDDDYDDDDDHMGGDDNVVLPKKLFVLKNENTPYSRCLFLPHEQSVTLSGDNKSTNSSSLTTCFVTASHTNSVITVWSAFLQKGIGAGGNASASPPTLIEPTKLQEINLSGMSSPSSSSFVLNVCYGPAGIGKGPPSSFLLLGSREAGRLYALHIKSEWSSTTTTTTKSTTTKSSLNNNGEAAAAAAAPAPVVPLCVGIDYMVPFSLKHPVYSWSVVCGPSDDIADNDGDGDDNAGGAGGAGFDMMAFSYQSKAIQNLKITNSMCLPPSSGGGVKSSSASGGGVFTVEPLSGPYVENANDPKYDEDEYDIEDIDEAIAPAAAAAAAKITTAPPATVPLPAPAPAAPAPSGGGLFPGAANPFANWLGGIASAVSSSTPKATADDDLPEPPPPPQPSAMGLGMDNPPPPPPPPPPSIAVAIMGTPPGMPSKTPSPSSPPVTADPEPPSGLTVQEFLNPLELLKNSQSAIDMKDNATAAVAVATNDDKATSNNNKQKKNKKAGRSKSPKKSRSKSPKGKRNNTNNNNQNKTPFSDTKVTILKRSPDSADSLSQLAGSATTTEPPPPPPQQVVAPVVAAVQQIDSKQLEEEVTKAVEKAISKLVPSINKTVQESFASLARPLRNSMDALSKNGVTVDSKQLKEVMDVATPLKAELANTVRTVLVPTLEAIAGQILNEVKTALPKLIPPPLVPLPPAPSPVDHQTPKLLAMLSQQLSDMSSKLDALTTEVQTLKATVADQAAVAQQQQHAANNDPPPPSQQQKPPSAAKPDDPNAQLIKVRNEVDALLRQSKYEEAFTKAVATTTPQMAVYCCARSDLNKVLQNGNTPCLSQAILICLMQQLSAALAHTQNTHQELQVEVLWLQEIALCMNPNDVSIQQHVPRILQQLITNVSNRISVEEQTDPNSQFRRPLQMLLQILRGMQ